MDLSSPLLAKIVTFRETRSKPAKASGLYPYFRPIGSGQDTEVIIHGRKLLMFGSNSYLGLCCHPEVTAAAKAAIDRYGSGCAGSRFLNGTLDLHLELEAQLAGLLGKAAVVLFPTGFQTNLGVVSTLVGRGEYIVADKENHASIVDGCLLSQGKFLRFSHNDPDSLARNLAKVPGDAGTLVVVDGVFSMSGDIAPLSDIATHAERHRAVLMVDDAHGIGVLGARGAGTCDHFGLQDKVQLIMGTFSKSLASIGGFIAGDEDTVDFLKHHCRPLIFSASISPPNAAAALAALTIMRREPERIARLHENSRVMRSGLKELGLRVGEGDLPIIPVLCGDTLLTWKMAMRLDEEGVFVNPVVTPAVPPHGDLLRISVTATHTDEQIGFALGKIEKVARELGLIGKQ